MLHTYHIGIQNVRGFNFIYASLMGPKRELKLGSKSDKYNVVTTGIVIMVFLHIFCARFTECGFSEERCSC